ncbi:hypothetical protein V1477_010397 [Vespula maculifrons]|uniref:Uncharacterized protein n=1 Tax=Vespula maculifrons TaxID=7453 RepID=A0ABD2C8H0_VESMC
MLGKSTAKSHEKIIIHKAQQLVLNYYTRRLWCESRETTKHETLEDMSILYSPICCPRSSRSILRVYIKRREEDGRLKLISVYGLKTTRRRYRYALPHGLLSSLSAVVFSTSPSSLSPSTTIFIAYHNDPSRQGVVYIRLQLARSHGISTSDLNP